MGAAGTRRERGLSMPWSTPAWRSAKLSFMPADTRYHPGAMAQIQIPRGGSIESATRFQMPDSQAFGDRWVREMRSAVLRVPSVAINGMEWNVVFNPAHSEFQKIELLNSEEFIFDPRFFF
jgi:hypothetical protein